MKRDWPPDELIEHWTLAPREKQRVLTKRGPPQLGFAVLLKVFQHAHRFPKATREVPLVIVGYLAEQLAASPEDWSAYDLESRTAQYHRNEIRKLLGFREVTAADGEALVNWLCDHCLATSHRWEYIESAAYDWLRQQRIEPPTPDRLTRLLKSALHTFNERFCTTVFNRLSATTQARLEALLVSTAGEAHNPAQLQRSCHTVPNELSLILAWTSL
jgi:hypothetical protein